jgi:hypothetical protein
MSTPDNPEALFIQAARESAIACNAAAATRCGTGLLLELSPSQLARDGLSIAASRFARSILDEHAINGRLEEYVRTAASKAPVLTWWKSRTAASRPRKLSEGDVWISAEDVRRYAAGSRKP